MGYINKSGELVIPCIYDATYEFHEGVAVVLKERKCGVKQAVEDKKIDNGRYERYCSFYQKIKEEKKW